MVKNTSISYTHTNYLITIYMGFSKEEGGGNIWSYMGRFFEFVEISK